MAENRRAELLRLAEQCEAATDPDRSLDVAVAVAAQHVAVAAPGPLNVRHNPENPGWLLFDLDGELHTNQARLYTALVDAALSLCDEATANAILHEAMDKLSADGWPAGRYREALARYVTAACLRARVAHLADETGE
jgi:hypothetical protein